METEILGIPLTIEKKKIKNIYLKVLPPNGKVVVSAPKRLSQRAIEEFVITKRDWIREKRKKYENSPMQEELQYKTGEQISFLGKKYYLEVMERSGSKKIVLTEDKIQMYIKEGCTKEQREQCLNEWYRKQLKLRIPELIEKWEPVMKVQVKEWNVKNMKTRWGTCNIAAQRIWLNLQLAKSKPECLEYVVVHEMAHLLERNHNERFYGYMDLFLPEWRKIRKELNEVK
jgi:predicted metal-dependent hydrolase